MSRLRRLTAFWLSLLITAGMLLLYVGIGHTGLAYHLETKTLDWRFRWRGVRSPGDQVVMVVIDDGSITALGRWPWSRQRFATLVHRLKNAGVRVIAFDLVMLKYWADSTLLIFLRLMVRCVDP
jgi:adenylate cyclase